MRSLFAIAALFACTAASPPVIIEWDQDEWPDLSELPPPPVAGDTVCRDRIHKVREELGLPALERETAVREEGYLIAAVDRRVDGCSVMVMRSDTRDIRPLPKADPRPMLRPAQ